MNVHTTISINAVQYRPEDVAAIKPQVSYLYTVDEVLQGTATTDYMTIRLHGTEIELAINGEVAERLAHEILAAVAARRQELGRRASVAELTEIA